MKKLLLACLLFPLAVSAQQSSQPPANSSSGSVNALLTQQQQTSEKKQAAIRLHTLEEIDQLLIKAEALVDQQQAFPDFEPVVFLLHGQEANFFQRKNYKMYQSMVDRAARLDAFKVIDIRVCETWMGDNMVTRNQMPAFVDTVPYWVDEQKKLQKQGYSYF